MWNPLHAVLSEMADQQGRDEEALTVLSNLRALPKDDELVRI